MTIQQINPNGGDKPSKIQNSTCAKSPHGASFLGALNENMKASEIPRVQTESSQSGKHNSGHGKSLDSIFQKASETYGVPVNLLKAMAKAESDFNPNVVSSCGAMGIMQLMPGTAKALGVVNPMDPEQNIMGGADYISQKLKMYKGDTALALAAYNAGSGSVAKYGGIPPFKETQNYIKKITGYMEQSLANGTPAPADPADTPSFSSITKASHIIGETQTGHIDENLMGLLQAYRDMAALALQIGKTDEEDEGNTLL